MTSTHASTSDKDHHYDLCAKCITILTDKAQEKSSQATLNSLASQYQLSPNHLQAIFKSVVGISPKQFEQGALITQSKPSILIDAMKQTSLNLTSPSERHKTFVDIKMLDPGKYQSKGCKLLFNWTIQGSMFGKLLVITTHKGLYYLGIHNSEVEILEALNSLQHDYPQAQIIQDNDNNLLGFDPFTERKNITLHLNASHFQIEVWQALLDTKPKDLLSYKSLALKLNKPNAARAVGRAVGANPITYLIPCHRVIQQSGGLSGYRWGTELKKQLIAWEHAINPA